MPEDSSNKTQAQAEARQKLMTLRLATDGIVLSPTLILYNANGVKLFSRTLQFLRIVHAGKAQATLRAGVQAGGGGCDRCLI